MRSTCPECDLEWDERACEHCGFVLDPPTLEQTQIAGGAGRDLSTPETDDDDDSKELAATASAPEANAGKVSSEDEETNPPEAPAESAIDEASDWERDYIADSPDTDDEAFLESLAGDTNGSEPEQHHIKVIINEQHVVDESTLLELTQHLPPGGSTADEFEAEDLRYHAKQLQANRLVLISCPDEDLAFVAAHALINSLSSPPPLARRLLTFDRSTAEGSQPSIFNLGEKPNPEVQTVVLVEGVTEKARQFFEPLINAKLGSSLTIQEDLRQKNLYLICLVNLDDLTEVTWSEDGLALPAKELKFPCWRIPFLQRLLEQHQVSDADEVEARLDAQRRRGWWSPNDGNFYVELKTLLARNQLMTEIERLDKTPPPPPVSKLFKGDDPLSDTILYVATFFPNLTPYEFNQIVPPLLGAATRNGGENVKGVTEVGESPLLQTWRTSPDRVLRDCKLVTVPIRDATKGVNFVNHSLRESLREYLTREFNFFLENRFLDTQRLGLLFSPSNRISEGAVQLSVEMAGSYPEYYGARWLENLVLDFEATLNGGPNAPPKVWEFIDETNPGRARRRFYERLSDLIRAMLRKPRLTFVVDEFLDQLVNTKHYREVLELIRRLQFVPAFDQYKWLKQLFHRGDPQVREQAADYLRRHLNRSGFRVHEVLSSLESWLPPSDSESPSYQMSARYALWEVLSNFRKSAARFNPRYFGAWPSSYALLAFRDADAAAANLPLLLRWLFHPGMKAVVSNGTAIVNRVITDWFFILRGTGEPREPEPTVTSDSASGFDGLVVSNLLLQEIARTATEGQQIALLDYWREASREILEQLSRQSYGNRVWARLAWKRDLIVELITSLTNSVMAARRVGIGV